MDKHKCYRELCKYVLNQELLIEYKMRRRNDWYKRQKIKKRVLVKKTNRGMLKKVKRTINFIRRKCKCFFWRHKNNIYERNKKKILKM